jgi:hypothetical protein
LQKLLLMRARRRTRAFPHHNQKPSKLPSLNTHFNGLLMSFILLTPCRPQWCSCCRSEVRASSIVSFFLCFVVVLAAASSEHGAPPLPSFPLDPTLSTPVPPPPKKNKQTEKLPTVQYRNGRPLRDLVANYTAGRTRVEVVIPADDCTGHNKQVKSRQLWGDGVYTDDSDLVAVLMHAGYYAATTALNPPQVAAFHAVVELLPPQARYPSSLRNSVRSRAWMAKVEGCSFKVERCFVATRSGHMVELTAGGEDGAVAQPTFAPNAGDRPMSTRSSAAGGGRNKQSPEVRRCCCCCLGEENERGMGWRNNHHPN